MYNNIVII